jgi:hypothetical protein
MRRISCVLTLAALLTVAGAVQASDPIGGYLTVDKVVLSPADAPTTIQIWGSFVLATGYGGKSYGTPERGYLYYKAPAGQEGVCRKEWSDLKKAAGTTQVIGFGSSYELKTLGKVRKADKKPESPDVYPLANGLVRGDANPHHTPIHALLALPAPLTPAEGDIVPPGTIALVTRNIADKKHPKAKYVFELKGASGDKEEATVEPGEKETRWTPKLKVKAGEKYTWTVRAAEGDWKGPPAATAFVVKGGK